MSATLSILGTTLSSNDLFKSITDKYDCRQIGQATKEENVTFYSNDSGRGGGGGSSSRKGVECFNFHKRGHKKADCWAKGGGKKGQGPKGKVKAQSQASVKDSAVSAKEQDAAWMAMSAFESGEFNMVSDLPSDFELLDLLVEGLFEVKGSVKMGEVDKSDKGPPGLQLNSDWSDDDTEPNSDLDESPPNSDDDNDEPFAPSQFITLDNKAYTTTFQSAMLTTGRIRNSLVDIDLYWRPQHQVHHGPLSFRVGTTPQGPQICLGLTTCRRTTHGNIIRQPLQEGYSHLSGLMVYHVPK